MSPPQCAIVLNFDEKGQVPVLEAAILEYLAQHNPRLQRTRSSGR